MKREAYAIAGGADGLMLVPETDPERAMTPVERRLVEVAMSKMWVRGEALREQAGQLSVRLRDLNGYGAYVHLDSFEARVEHVADNAIQADFGVASVSSVCERSRRPGSRNIAEAMIFAPWREQALGVVIFAAAGRLDCIELYPVDGENWTVREVERLLFASADELRVEAMDGD